MSTREKCTSLSGRRMSRREVFAGVAGAAAMTLVPRSRSAHAAEEKERQPVARRGRINQSVAHWCFEPHWSMGRFCQIAKKLGCKSIELVPPENWPMLKEYGLTCAIISSHSFVRGTNNPLHWDECLTQLEKAIDDASDMGFGSVITFTGYGDTSGEEKGSKVSPEQGAKNCVAASLVTMLAAHGIEATETEMARLSHTTIEGGTTDTRAVYALQRKLASGGFTVRYETADYERLKALPLPCVVSIDWGYFSSHMVPVLSVDDAGVTLGDPLTGPRQVDRTEFTDLWYERAIYLQRRGSGS